MLEMPNPNSANHPSTPNPSNLSDTVHNLKINPRLSPTRVIDVTAPRQALNRIEKKVRLYASRIDELATELRALVDNLGADIVTATRSPASATVSHIIECVADHTGIGTNAIRSIRRDVATVRARHIAFYLASELTMGSLTDLGSYFGRDHTTILFGVRKIRRLMSTDKILRDDVEAIAAIIEGRQ